jgi:hypothetical protein
MVVLVTTSFVGDEEKINSWVVSAMTSSKAVKTMM